MNYLVRHPNAVLRGEIQIQPSKSMANRLLILDHLYGKRTSSFNIPAADDSRILRDVLQAINNHSGSNPLTLDVKDGGTTSRFLLALLAFTPGVFILEGSKRLTERPILPLIQNLRKLGARIEGDKLPLTINGFLPAVQDHVSLSIDTSTSSQFASSLLMILPRLCNSADVMLTGDHLSLPYLDLTIRMMNRFGFDISREGQLIRYSAPTVEPTSRAYELEPDYSSVAFWVGMVALSKNAEVSINAADFRDSLQGDSIVIDRAVAHGIIQIKESDSGLLMTNSNRPNKVQNLLVDYTDCPDLALPELVMYGSLGFGIRFTGTQTLRLKESSRLDSFNEGMQHFGLKAVRSVNGHRLEGKFSIPDSVPHIPTFHDHRVAMAFSMLSLKCPVMIEDPDVVSKSYPSFWDDLRKLNFDVIQNP